MSRVLVALVSMAFVACAQAALMPRALAGPHDALIAKHAAANGVPEALVRRIIMIESRGQAGLSHAGNYGLMQIRLGTARGLGYSGDARGLLDPDTNLAYAVKYLAGAYRAAGCDANRAVRYYQRGYHGVRQASCAAAAPAVVEVVEARPKPEDVLQPRVVRIETIGAGNAPAMPTRPVGRFEPARVTAQPAPFANVPVPPPSPAKFRLASIPLPPVRPDFDSAPKKIKEAKPSHHPVHKRAPASAKRAAKKTAAADDPIGVVAFVKKIVTPAKPSGQQPVPDMPSPAPPL